MLRHLSLLLASGTLLSAAGALTFEDNFDGIAIDGKKWEVQDVARRDARNTPRAVDVRGGVLRVTTFTENGQHRTGFLTTQGKFQQVQGRFEARIRFSNQPGMWSAFWSMPMTYGKSKNPDKADVDGLELDIVEQLHGFGGHFDTTIHWGGYGPPHQRTRTQRNKPAAPANQGWHTYAVEWDADGYRFFYDGEPSWVAPKDIPIGRAPQHIILSSEVKDGGWAGKVPQGSYGDKSESKAFFEVDWVRAWAPSKK